MMSTALVPTNGGTNNSNTTTTSNTSTDPYLTNDFHPLSLASLEILSALRADESAPDADLYRRLISSSGVGAHRYHVVNGHDGCGEVGSNNTGGGTAGNGGSGSARQSSSTSTSGGGGGSTHNGGNVIGSPLGVLRGSRQYNSSSSPSSSSRSSSSNNNNGPSSPSQSTTTPQKSSVPPTSYLKHNKSVPLPNALAIQSQKARLSSIMGLLPQANLVWLTCDDTLYLWSYKSAVAAASNNGGDMNTQSWGGGNNTPATPSSANSTSSEDYCSFTVPSGQCIASIGLVKPKPNIFKKEIGWCLVVTTPEEVILCALVQEKIVEKEYVVLDEGNPNEGTTTRRVEEETQNGGFRHGTDEILRLIPTRYVMPTDSIPIISIAGTKTGRIFLGGYDGNLYEFIYEGNGGMKSVGRSYGGGSEVMEAAIDDYFDGRGVFTLHDGSRKKKGTSLNSALSGSKRVISALTFGILDDESGGGNSHGDGGITPRRRASKCRKINHTSSASSFVSSVLPGPVLRMASSMFGSSIEVAAKKCGPIVDIVLDEERLCLYTLGSKGVICVYDIAPLSSSSSSSSSSGDSISSNNIPPPRLSSVLDTIETTKLYLDSVSRGRMYPPTTSQNVALGTITFPGGISSAQAGVGGMEGAREILKRYNLESRIIKSATAAAAASSSSANGINVIGVMNELSNTAGILQPVSIHLVPPSESKSLTLVAITGGGLRYYLSSLSSSYINSAQSGQGGFDSRGGGNLDPRLARMRPGRKMIFCHVRAPPPYTSNNGNDGFRFELAPSAVNLIGAAGSGGGLPPGLHGSSSGRVAGGGSSNNVSSAAGDVVKGSYSKGVFVLALDVEKKGSARNTASSSSDNNFFSTPEERNSTKQVAGDAIVVTLPDFAARVTQSNSSLVSGGNNTVASSTQTQPGGISEAVILPMSGVNGTASPVLPGGRTFDISANTDKQKSSVVSLFVNSATPSDVELQIGLLPSFAPKKKTKKPPTSKNGTTSSALVISTDRGRGIISSTLSALSYYLRSGQAFGYPVGTVSNGSNKFGPTITYRVSGRHGCDSVGFSNSAGESFSTSTRNSSQGRSNNSAGSSTASAKSARLPSWLLRPSSAPLNAEASQHLLPLSPNVGDGSPDVLILNSGGLHFFSNSSLLNNLASVLLRANNIARDTFVRNFFTSYGYVEGCAMCFALATSSSSSAVLRGKAEQAAMCYANRPAMKLTGPTVAEGMAPITSYTFQPSSLYEGLVKFISRLLRPFWYKPGVVVTEGRPIHSKSAYANYYAALPAKVELLLDDVTLEEIRRPLVLLQNLMKKTFVPVVHSIPGGVAKKDSNDAMDVDDNGLSGGLITRAMQNQNRAATQRLNNPNQSQHAATPKELQTKAFDTENRNMHSLYRLLSRCVQILNLMSCLKRAQETPALPEVQWGLLHGITYYQLVTSQEGQARIESLLNALVSQGEKTLVNGLSTDGDLLADTLSRQCYLFFSSASRLTYLGFRSANDALSRPITSPQRSVLSNQAASYLRAASRHWYSPPLIAGRKTPNRNGSANDWEEVAMNAKEAGSPLALAADILMKLNNVEGLADICLICASNFGGAKVTSNKGNEKGEENVQDMLGWEKGLYHRPPLNNTGGGFDSRSTAIVTGIDVTESDALRTCHSIIFHYISKLLGEAGPSSQRLAEELVASCAASTDTKFLHSLYEFLLATNNVETALRIASPSLENWLLKNKKDLLWKYYSFHGRNVLAGDMMFKEAMDESTKLALDQRIEYLTRAANSFSLALNVTPSDGVNMSRLIGRVQGATNQEIQQDPPVSVQTLKKRIRDIQDQLDVATIQKRILTTISQSQDVNLGDSEMYALKFILLDVTKMYNDYACALNLFDVCLLLLGTCQERSTSSITCLWKSIICEEVLPCSTSSESVVEFLAVLKQGSMLEEEEIVFGSGAGNVQQFENGEWIPRLRNRVTALGKELFGKGADYTFPLDLIVKELEGLRQVHSQTCDEGAVSQPWPAQTILDVGNIPFFMLLESYDSLQINGLSTAGGVDTATQLQRLASISELLEMWVDAALSSYSTSPMIGSNNLYPSGEVSSASSELTRAVNLGLLNRIHNYKLALEGLVGGNNASALEERFVKVEEIIRKDFLL